MSPHDRFHVITGGPGSGKTTLVEALAAGGVACMPEAGRAIIRDQIAIGGTALPWVDPLAFAEQMLGWEMRSWREAGRLKGPVVFDRGAPDIIGYLRLTGVSAPAHMEAAARRFRYAPTVFAAPPWPEIFTSDAERRQTWQEAVDTHDAVVAAWRELGYEVLALPRAPVADRVAVVMAAIGAGGAT